jgi:GH25 family lysozyme M1 (1,4-beta-N-acetylmuramidase)
MSLTLNLPPGIDPASVVPGVDLSHWSADVDFGELYDAGIRWVITKCTGGATQIDSKWDIFKAKAAVISAEHDDFFFGGFHYFDPWADSIIQAGFSRQIMKPGPGMIVPTLDNESGGTLVGPHSWGFATNMATAIGRYPMLYSGEDFYLANLESSFRASVEAGHTRLWLARYRDQKPDTPCDIWQFSQSERVEHEPGVMDADVFFGTVEQFRERMVLG